jgi:hypothetical protein
MQLQTQRKGMATAEMAGKTGDLQQDRREGSLLIDHRSVPGAQVSIERRRGVEHVLHPARVHKTKQTSPSTHAAARVTSSKAGAKAESNKKRCFTE